MNLDTIIKLKNNPIYFKYLHEHSNWYKILNRNPDLFNDFIKEMKTNYKLRRIDKLSNTINMIETIENILGTIK